MKLKGINLKSVYIKRQHVIAVIFLCGFSCFIQSGYASDYKIANKTTSHINYFVDDNITVEKTKYNQRVNISDTKKSNLDLKLNTTPDISEAKIITLRPAVSIIIDDIGDRLKDGMRAVSLPAPYTYSFLPNTPFAKRLAKEANSMNKEVMLHIPMQATNGKKLGPNGLTMDMTRELFDKTLTDAFKSIPYVRGINNHMGSLLTTNKQNMNWVMSFVAKQENKIYFVDSRTTAGSVIVQAAKEQNINVLSRDTFIDYEATVESVTEQIHYLIKLAKKNGSAVGIAHPYPATLEVLEKAWPIFYEAGVDLIPVSELVTLTNKRELSEWRLSSSH